MVTTPLFGNMRKHIIILSLLLSGSAFSQEMTFDKATRLGPGVNGEAEDINPRLSADGQRLYFTRAFHRKNRGGAKTGHDTWYSDKMEGVWTEAKNLAALNNRDNNAVVGINDEGNKLFLVNNYTAHPIREQGIAYSVNKNEKWASPVEMPIIIHLRDEHYGFYVTPDESVIVISMTGEDSKGNEDLYVSFKEGESYTAPKHLGNMVNTGGFEISPYLSPDKTILYFSSDGLGGAGSADIFYSKRLDESWTQWSTPVNLGENINSSAFDAYFFVDKNGRAYFSSDRNGGMSDIYQATGTLVTVNKEVEAEAVVTKEDEAGDGPIAGLVEPAPAPAVIIPSTRVIYFGFDKTDLTPGSLQELKQVYKSLMKEPRLVVELSGHADVRGDERYNDELSRKRAEAAKAYLISERIPGDRIKTNFYGEKAPLNKGNSSPDHSQDRRVEIMFKERR